MSGWLAPEVLAAIGWAVVVAVAGGLLTEIGPWYRGLNKPSWQPPDWAFGPIWTTIFTLAAFAAVWAWRAAPDEAAHTRLIAAYLVNGALNILWSPLFFKWRRPDWALIEVIPLWLSVLALIVVLLPLSGWGAAFLLPYLIWVTIAAYLNLTIVRLNAPFTVQSRA